MQRQALNSGSWLQSSWARCKERILSHRFKEQLHPDQATLAFVLKSGFNEVVSVFTRILPFEIFCGQLSYQDSTWSHLSLPSQSPTTAPPHPGTLIPTESFFPGRKIRHSVKSCWRMFKISALLRYSTYTVQFIQLDNFYFIYRVGQHHNQFRAFSSPHKKNLNQGAIASSALSSPSPAFYLCGSANSRPLT